MMKTNNTKRMTMNQMRKAIGSNVMYLGNDATIVAVEMMTEPMWKLVWGANRTAIVRPSEIR